MLRRAGPAGVPECPDLAHETLFPFYAELAELIGRPAAVRLAHGVRGQRLYVPERATKRHWLSVLIGYDEARVLVGKLGPKGAEHDFPSQLYWNGAAERLADALRMFRAGWSVAQIGQTLHVGRRSVFNYKAKLREQGRLPPNDRPNASPDDRPHDPNTGNPSCT